jgi:hypothetical protein
MHGTACVMFGDNFTLEQALKECKQGRDKINGFIADIYKEMKQQAPPPHNMKNVLFPIVRDFNCVVGDNWTMADVFALFGAEHENTVKTPTVFNTTDTIYDILVEAGAFESKGQARKNWRGIKEVPTGYSEIGPIGKQKLMLFIWNPTE